MEERPDGLRRRRGEALRLAAHAGHHTQLGYDRWLRMTNTHIDRPFERLAVVGAGNMGSGIAQKMATEGFQVVLVDLDDGKVARGLQIIESTLADGVGRGIFSSGDAAAIAGRVTGTAKFDDLAGVDLVVEAVFEDLAGQEGRLPETRRRVRPGHHPRDQHLVLLRHGTRRGDASSRAGARPALLLPPGEEPPRRSDCRRENGCRAPAPGVAAAGGAGQDPDRLAGLVRLHRESFLPPVADRSGSHRGGRPRERRDRRRGGEEGLRHRHGAFPADERDRRTDRAPCRDDARPRVRPDVRGAAAPSHAGGIGSALGDRGNARSGAVQGGRRSVDGRSLLRRRRARGRERGHDRGHRHRRTRGPPVAARSVRADESPGDRSSVGSRSRLRRIAGTRDFPRRSSIRRGRSVHFASPSCALRLRTGSRR